eukprot:167254-Prorocentrum_lima.AAC.1
MTSSLVGSEMCIRDRRVAAQPVLPARKEGGGAAAAAAAARPAVVSAAAVSYTHLTLPTICSV